MIDVIFLSLNPDTPPRGYWDMGMIEDIFSKKMWQPANGFDYRVREATGVLPKTKGAVIVFPARAQVDYINDLNAQLKRLKWVVLILTGDEESVFPVEQIKHNNIRIWVQEPRKGRHDKHRKLGTGYSTEVGKVDVAEQIDKDLDYFFSGQVTHKRRTDMIEQLDNMTGGEYLATEGFTQGFEPAEYFKLMQRAKTAPAPSGPETPNSFRLFEALEAGAVPIADTRVIKQDFPDDYWTWFFDEEPPFPVLTEYEQLPGYIADSIRDYPRLNNRVVSWWIKYKRSLCYTLVDDLNAVGAINKHDARLADKLTVLVPTSVMPSCPDTRIIEQTIDSVRELYPVCEIIITIDGLRKEQEDRRQDYEEYIQNLIWLCRYKWRNTLPIIFEENTHQVGMARVALQEVKTPFILYVEHDTPIVTDEPIETLNILHTLETGELNMVRLHFEAVIPKEHTSMMLDKEPKIIQGCPIIRTAQWSQRPHFSTKAFYEHITRTYFSENAKTFYEDLLHGKVLEDWLHNREQGWFNWRVGIYAPAGNYKRSYHIDGREGTEKYDKDLVF